jgi:O-antigen ligase
MLNKKIATSINIINLISCLYLTASSLYYTKFQQIGFLVFFISFFLEIFIDKKWKNFQFDKAKIYYLGLLLFFLLIFIYHPFENSNKYFNRLVELRLALFGFAIVGFFGVNKLFKVSYFANIFIVSSVFAMLFIIFGIGINEFIVNPQRSNLVSIFRIEHINSHIVFNSYLNIALVCCWYLIFNTKAKFNTLRILFYLFSSISIIYFLFISEGRIGIAICAVLLFSVTFYQLWKVNKLFVIALILITPFVIWVIASNHKRMSKDDITSEPRLFIWKAAAEVLKKQPILGYGASRAQEVFDVSLNKYETKEYRESYKETRIVHSHNQFIQTYMEFGIIGIILLLGLISLPLILTEPKRRFFAILLLFIIISQFMTDIVITYQGFPVIFGIFTLMTIAINIEQKQLKEQIPLV